MTARPNSSHVRAVLEGVVRRASASELRRARRHGCGNTAQSAAVLVTQARDRDIADAVCAVVAELDGRRALAAWLLRTAFTVVRMPGADIVLPAPTVATSASALELPGELAARLAPWLVDLLGDAAEYLGGLRIVEEVSVVEGAAHGAIDRTAHPVTIGVAPGLPAARLELVIAHEVAHALDELLGDRTLRDLEAFADELAELVVRHRPRNIASVLQLVPAVDVPAPTPSARDDELTDLVLWALACESLDLRRAQT